MYRNVLDQRLQVAIVESPDPALASRLAMTQVVSEYLGECEPTIPSFAKLLKDLSIETLFSFAGRAKKVHGGCVEKNPCSQREFERLIGTMISGPVSLVNPEVEYRAILSEDRCYFGKTFCTIDRGGFQCPESGETGLFSSRE